MCRAGGRRRASSTSRRRRAGDDVRDRVQASGQDVGPDDFGDALHLRGPAGTACAGRLLGDDILGFASGPATFLLGPRAPRPRYDDATSSSYRVASPWCPGRYTGWVEEHLGEFGTRELGRFAAHARAPRSCRAAAAPARRGAPAGQSRRAHPATADHRPDDRHGRLRDRRTNDEYLGLRLRSPQHRGCRDPDALGGVFRPGRGRLRLGPHARELGGNDRAFRIDLCTGRWIGFIGDLAFTFVVGGR